MKTSSTPPLARIIVMVCGSWRTARSASDAMLMRTAAMAPTRAPAIAPARTDRARQAAHEPAHAKTPIATAVDTTERA
jgi:hypothetical protein